MSKLLTYVCVCVCILLFSHYLQFGKYIEAIDFTCSEHMASLMLRYQQHENDEVWLKTKQNEQFPEWFRKKVSFISVFITLLRSPD